MLAKGGSGLTIGFINDREAQMWAQKLEMQGYSYAVLKNTGSTMIREKRRRRPLYLTVPLQVKP